MLHINTKFLQRFRQASRWFALLLLACLAGGVAQAQTLSFTPGLVTALTSTDSAKGSADPKYTGPLSGLILTHPQALTFDSDHNLFIVDAAANVVRVVAGPSGKPIPSLPSVKAPVAGTVYTVAGSGSKTPSTSPLCTGAAGQDERSTVDNSFYGNGCPATSAILNFLLYNHLNGDWNGQTSAPIGQVALDSSGNLYITDGGDNQVRVVYAGGDVKDQNPALLARLPAGVTPIQGNIYPFAGSVINQKTSNYDPDTGFQVWPPLGVAVDASGDVYILLWGYKLWDQYGTSSTGYSSNLAVVSNGGSLPNTLAGTTLSVGQYALLFPLNSGTNGPPWKDPTAIALDSSGNIYMSDSSNGTGSVYVIYAGGTVPGLLKTLAGATPVEGNAYLFAGSGTLAPAYLPSVPATQAITANPTQLAIDYAGDLYTGIFNGIYGNSYMVKVDPSGDLALFAGNLNIDPNTGIQVLCAATTDYFGDGCPANQVAIIGPFGVATAKDGSGSIYYADADQNPNTGFLDFYALHKIDGSTTNLQFATVSAGVASAAQVVTISNVDAQPLNISAINFPNNFIQVASGGTDCAAPTTLTPGQSCQVAIEFLPVSGTASGQQFSDNVIITSDSTNADAGVNSIAVSGTAKANSGTTSQNINNFTLPSTVTYGQTIPLTATATSGLAVIYQASGPARIQGNTLKVTGVGSITVTAYQPGDNGDTGNASGWAAATPVAVPITAQAATLTVTANNFDQIPGLPIPTLTYSITGFVNGDTQATATTGVPALATTATVNSPPGNYSITITQGTLATTTNNYTLSFVNGNFMVDARLAQTITFTQTLPTVTYGARPITLTATASSGLPITYTVTGNATIIGSFLSITGAGPVAVTANQPGDVTYVAAQSVTQSFLVQPATLTFTADSLNMAQGSVVPALTYTVGGYVNSDTAATVWSGTPALATTATSSSPVGGYPITIAQTSITLLSTNYTASFVKGTMNVVTGSPQTITFGALPNVTYGVAPFALNATSSSSLPVTYTLSFGAFQTGLASITNNVLTVLSANGGPAGIIPTVTVTATQVGNATYTAATPVSQTFTIAQAPLTVTANNLTIVNDTPFPAFPYTITGFVNGDTAATAVTGTPHVYTTAAQGSAPGTYPIDVDLNASYSSLQSTNYTFTNFVPGILTITSGGPAQNFTMTLSTQNLTILNGSVGQATLTISPTNYYHGVLNLSCTGLPANASCVFSPAALNVTLNYASSSSTTPIPITGTLTITTSNAPVVGSLSAAGGSIYSASIAGWASLLFGLILAWQRRRLARYKTIWVLAMAVCLGGMAASLTACGSSNSFSLTKSGTSTIQVVATDSNGGPVNSIPLAITIK